MCTNVNQKDLITAHREMLHVQYFLHYRHQPKVFRDGANPGINFKASMCDEESQVCVRVARNVNIFAMHAIIILFICIKSY